MPQRLLSQITGESVRLPLRSVIVGGGNGCRSFLEMVHEDKLGRFQLKILGVADTRADAPGITFARELGVELVTTDYRELFAIEDLHLIIELTGLVEVRDEIERQRPRGVKLIDHFGATLFWEVYTVQQEVIKQRTEMRERVEAEREWVSQIFDSIPDEIVVVDSEMRVQDANASFLLNNNLSIQEVHGRNCYELEQRIRGECQVAIADCPFFDVIKTKQASSMVRKHFTAEGEPRYAAIVAAPLFDRQGAVIGIIECTRDITRRIRAEEELKVTEVQLKHFMELAPISTFVKNTKGQYLEANPALCQLFGHSKGEILGRTDLEILPRDTAEVFRTSDRTVLSTKQQTALEGGVRLKDAEVFLNTIKYPVLDAEGRVLAVCGMIRDVTALKEAEQALTRTRDYLQNVLNHSPMIVITTDLEGRIVSFNPRAAETLGYEHDEVIGQPAASFYKDPKDRDLLIEMLEQRGVVRDYETMLLRKDGSTVPVSVTLSKLKDAEGQMMGTIGISRDISHRKALMDLVMQSERLAAVGRLAAGVAHEINNPLAVISEIAGYLEELLQDDPQCADPGTRAELASGIPKVRKQVARCRSITHRLLSFSRKSEVKVEVADITRALKEIMPFLEKEAALANIQIHWDHEAAVPRVRIDEVQLQEIFINLLNNAIQAIGKRGQGQIWIDYRLDGARLEIAVRDDGPGIPEEVRGRLFDPFVTSKAPGQGTGLGLSICYGIVKRHDGAITVDSEPGVGTTFKVLLPVSD